MCTASLILLSIVASAIESAPAGGASCTETVDSPFVLPGGIADPAGRNGFLTNVDGSLSAVDLRSGKVLWDCKAAHRAIAVDGERLYASAPAGNGRLRVVGLAYMRKGEVVFESDPIPLPTTAGRQIESIHWIPDHKRLLVALEIAGATDLLGGAAVDLQTGRVQPIIDALPGTAVAPPKDLERRMVRWQGVVGGVYKAAVLEESATGQRFNLMGWNASTGQQQSVTELLGGKRLVIRATLNEQHLCLRDAMPSPDVSADEKGRNAWIIFDVHTGERIARIPYEAGTQTIAVLGTRAFYLVVGGVPGNPGQPFVSPRKVKAIEMKTGKTLWERPIEGKLVTPVGT